MQQYLDLLRTIKEKGTQKPPAREGMPGSLSLFGYQFRHDLSTGFPALTTKKLFFKGVLVELLWFLNGRTDVKYLLDNGVGIWSEDSYNYYLKLNKIHENGVFPLTFDQFIGQIKLGEGEDWYSGYDLGDTGYQYGRLWRNWGLPDTSYPAKSVDQIKNVIQSIKESPMSRRHIVTAWDPAHLNDMALNACHILFQFNCRPLTLKQQIEYVLEKYESRMILIDGSPLIKSDGTLDDSVTNKYNIDMVGVPKYCLDCKFVMRSTDVVLGLPFNMASYALLTHMIAKICNMIPGELIVDLGDVHCYEDHIPSLEEQLTRKPYPLPTLEIVYEKWEEIGNTFDFSSLTSEDFKLENYQSHPPIKAKLSTGLR